MAYDFRASQVRTNKLITSGSTGTPAKLLVYDISADGTPANQGNINTAIFNTSSIGADTFIFFSGSKGTIDQSNGGLVVFGGDTKVSGTIAVAESNAFLGQYFLTFSNVPNLESEVVIGMAEVSDYSVGLITDLLVRAANVGVSGSGGNLELRAGNAGLGPGTSIGYQGGDIEYYAGTGNSPTAGNKKGGTGGKHYFVAGDGGNQDNSGFGGGGGTGGGFEFYSGFGGGTVEGAGGSGGNFSFNCGNGSGGPSGGQGGGVEFYTGNGGGGSTGNGGAGGNFYVETGDGGDAGANSGPIYAGAGGDVSFYLGDGGNDENTDEVAGAGGRFVVVAGNGGSSDSGTQGAPGTISLEAGNSFLSPGFIELKVGTKYSDPDTFVAERYGTIYLTDRSDQVNSVYNSANNDEFLVVSGSITSGSSARYASFRGSIKTSGALAWADDTYILKDGNDLRFFDTSNPGGYSLTQLGTGGGGGGGSSFPTRVSVGNYTTVTQSNSQTVGGNYIVSSEHQSGSILMRSILSTSDALNTAHLRLFSITDGYYLPIGGAGVFELNTTSTTPTVLTSANLNSIITSSILVEVQVSGTIGGGSLAIVHHNSDLIFSS